MSETPAPYVVGMDQQQKITGHMRAMFYALTDLASNSQLPAPTRGGAWT